MNAPSATTTARLLAVALLFGGGVTFGENGPLPAFHRDPAPPACAAADKLFWIADTRKMDRFLAQLDFTALPTGAATGEVLPDTRVVWRDYARQAWAFANRADDSAVNERIGQMLKLAALYRQFGGLQNVAQGEEIRALAGETVQSLGYGGRIDSPYLEANAEDCVALIERQAGREKGEVRPIFWRHFVETACQSFAHLTGRSFRGLAALSPERYAP